MTLSEENKNPFDAYIPEETKEIIRKLIKKREKEMEELSNA